MLLSIIIVNYNSGEMLRDCLKSIYDSQISFEFETIVIDNASADDSLGKAKSSYPDVVYIENHENTGFARANNQGIRMAKGKYILIQNPDTLVIGNAIERLVDYVAANHGVGIAAGKLLNGDRTLQHSIRRFPSASSQLFEACFLHKLLPRLSKNLGEVVLDDTEYSKPLDVDWISGAIMLINREALEKVGMLDESFFLYAEEVDWCYRMKLNGWRILYYPEAVFVHFKGKTKANLRLYVQHIRARRQFNYKHFNGLRARNFDTVSLLFLFNRALLFFLVSLAKPSKEAVEMRDLYYQSGKALLEMMVKGPEVSPARAFLQERS